ncbi:LysR family transcriptional regulator [Pigmentiphaga litoralis]|uniref:LysR family transcriptional regulator n=1 Tax=Pigmentiphaga litoralis TaxID=516702 RepID=UPI0016754C8A|nr:LysR family transcriptional regulator [Pigmentiphaga litoralis]GGX22031.1 LysR family transcriptional regulator [Pigmentiphaga litoralis]
MTHPLPSSPTLSELRAFVAVADAGHFTKAAERLGLSQSSLSAAIGRLEAALGTRVFDRHTRGCRLTDTGSEMLPAARRLLHDLDTLVDGARSAATLQRGRVTIAAPSAQCTLMLPPLVREFTQQHPGVRVAVHDIAEEHVREQVRTGAADLGIATQTDERTELIATPFYSDQYIVAMRKDHPLAARKSVEWSHVCKEPIIGPLPGNPVRRHLDQRLAREGLQLEYRYEVSLPWTMVGLAREGLGVSVLTLAVKPLVDWLGLAMKPIGRPSIARTLVVLRPPGRVLPPVAAAFRDLLLGSKAK